MSWQSTHCDRQVTLTWLSPHVHNKLGFSGALSLHPGLSSWDWINEIQKPWVFFSYSRMIMQPDASQTLTQWGGLAQHEQSLINFRGEITVWSWLLHYHGKNNNNHVVIGFWKDLVSTVEQTALCCVKTNNFFGPRRPCGSITTSSDVLLWFSLILQRSLPPDGSRMSFEGTLNQPMLVFLWGETESLPGRESLLPLWVFADRAACCSVPRTERASPETPERVLRSVSNVTALQMLHTETVESGLDVTHTHTHKKKTNKKVDFF